MGQIKFPFIFGSELPRSSVTLVDGNGNLRSFSYLVSKNRVKPSLFEFEKIEPQEVMELEKGLEITFSIVINHSLP